MDVLGSAGQLELSLSRTQMDEERQVRALASGLRVVSAADDPSGLAIAENIHTKVLGLQQGVQNVQTANNLLATADATLATVQSILSRIHSLIVEAASDLNSNAQLSSIQEEIDTLLHEINKISEGASFNGVHLFDGSLSATGSAIYNTPTVMQITPMGTSTGTDVYDASGSGTPNAGPLIYNAIYGSSGFVPGFVQFEITGYSTNPTDPNTGSLGAPGVYVKITQYSTDPNFDGANGSQEQVSISALYTNAGPDQGTGTPLFLGNADNSQNMLQFDLANLSQQDVGVAMAFETFDASSSSTTSGHALQINSSGNEGGIVSISLPSVSTNALGISTISVLAPQVVDFMNNVSGTDSNEFATADAEARVQSALDAISQVRAKVGAQSVSLQEDAADASLEVVNQAASESAIRDVDMGQSVTQFTRDQIMSQIGISVLAQVQQDAQLVIQLVGAVNPGIQGKV
jgi:flagellin